VWNDNTAIKSEQPPAEPETFQEYVDTLPEWERKLLQEVRCENDDFEKAAEEISLDSNLAWQRVDPNNPNKEVLGAHGISDGSVKLEQGTFGWSIRTKEDKPIATGKGASYGYPQHSFRAEAYGMLSMLLFMVRNLEFHMEPFPTRIEVFTDNSGLVKRIRKKRGIEGVEFPNSTLDGDWDVVQAIVKLIKKFPSVNVKHIKGHQDKETPIQDLSMTARMNVEADQLAGEYQYESHHVHDQVPMITGTGVQVEGPKGTITSQLENVLRQLGTEEALIKYLLNHEKWTSDVLDRIDWKAYENAVRNCRAAHAQFITKLTMDLLPTGKRVYRYKPYYDHCCPSCGEAQEDRKHVLRCKHDTRKE
jgi:ribonuclease HI